MNKRVTNPMKKIILISLLFITFSSCANNNNNKDIEIYEIKNVPAPEELQVIDSMTFWINEFIQQNNVELSILAATSVVHSLPYRFGDAGDLYENWTLPTIQEFYHSGLIDDSFELGEQRVAIVKVFAFYPDNVFALERGAQFDCYLITLGNAIDISKGKIFLTGLYDTKYPSDQAPLAVVEGDLSQLIEFDALNDEQNYIPADVLEKFRPTRIVYDDGTVHQPRFYLFKNGARLINQPPRTRKIEPVIAWNLNITNPQIIQKIKEIICKYLPLLPEEIETQFSNDGAKMKIVIPFNFDIDPYVLAEQLRQEEITLDRIRKPLILCDDHQKLIQFLGSPPEITKTFESSMNIEEGAYSDPFYIIPHKEGENKGKTEIIVGVQATADYIRGGAKQTEFQAQHHFIEGHDSRDVLLFFQNKYNYGYKEKLNFFKQAISQNAIDCTLFNRNLYFVFNADKSARFYPQNNLLAVGNRFVNYPILLTEQDDETIIDLDINKALQGDEIPFLANIIGIIDKSIFVVTDKDGAKKRFRVHFSDKIFNKIFDARIKQLLDTKSSNKLDNYRKLFDEIVKKACLVARIEMQVSKPDEDNARTIRNAKYFINQAVDALSKEDIYDFEWDVIFSSHKNDTLYPVQPIPPAPRRIFAIIKEEQVGLKDIELFKDYIEIINPDINEWQQIYELRFNYIKNNLELMNKEAEQASENQKAIKIEEAKSFVKREVQAHSDIPFFVGYVKLLKSEFAEYLK